MADNKTLTTGQISGLLGIPATTLRRYIRLYGKHFSKSARILTRGRRWTQSDIGLLLTIRQLSHTHMGISAIDQALTNQNDIASPQATILDAFTVLCIASKTLEQVHQERLEIEKIVKRARWTDNLQTWLGKRLEYIDHQLEELRYQNNKTRLYLNPPRRYPINKKYKKVWDDFTEWFHQTERALLDKMP
jgi:DNA-binding transcriptional MerR regulator